MPKGKAGMAGCTVEKAIPKLQTKTPASGRGSGLCRVLKFTTVVHVIPDLFPADQGYHI